MALEAELLFLTFIFEVKIEGFHAAATLNRPNAETLAVRETINRCCRILQWRLDHICRIKLVGLKALLEVPNMQ